MKTSSYFKSNYMRAIDVDGSITGKIAEVKAETMRLDGKEKIVVYLHDREQGLILNKTNHSVLAKLFGDESDGWIGKAIEVFSAPVEFRGDVTNGLRVRAVSELDADIPF